MIGEIFERYRIVEKLGEGGMATVGRARHETVGRDVALKILHPHLSASTRNRKRFAREAQAIERLRHPNIVEILDFSGENAPDAWIVTEYVDGETLGSLLDRCGVVPSEIVAELGVALCDALTAAHAEGILHRDLKPDNVMIRRDGAVKLMDFGIARFLDDSQLTLTGALVGSPLWMSPEAARDETLDARSDLFSLGVVLFQAATGRLPFEGSNPSVVLRNVIDGRRPEVLALAPATSAGLADAIEAALSPSIEARPPSAAAMRRTLAAVSREVDTSADGSPWTLAALVTEGASLRARYEAALPDRLRLAARAHLDRGETVAGLRLVDRLLTIRPDDAEALDLVQRELPLEADGWSAPSATTLAVVGAMVLIVAPLSLWLALPPSDPRSDPASGQASDEAQVAKAAPPEAASAPASAPPAARAQPAAEVAGPVRPGLTASATTSPPRAATGVPGPTVSAGATTDRASPRPTFVRAPATFQGDAPSGPPSSPAATEAAPVPACVSFRALAAPADVFLDGKRIGTTRDRACALVPSGTQNFTLQGAMIRPASVRLDLAPGEQRIGVVVDLERLPARLRFASRYDAACLVSRDGAPIGTLAAQHYAIELPDPDQRHVVTLRCDDTTSSMTIARLDYPEAWFEPEATR
ncbi:MAG: hypothetical protein RLZZ383_525 [Pseudomonadota bacterium]